MALRSRVSQASVSRLEAGDVRISLAIVFRIMAALGMDLSVKAYPGAGIGLRDSGQLALAELIRAQANESWRVAFEVPTREDGRQAADLVFFGVSGGLHLELESRLVDFQAQLRSGQLKREAIQQRHAARFAFVLALRDTLANRAAVRAHAGVVRAALPSRSSDIWRSIRTGGPMQADGLLWLRPAMQRRAIRR